MLDEYENTYSFSFRDGTGFDVGQHFSADTWTEVAAKFLRFLRASGFDYINGFTVHTDIDPDGTFVGTDDI